MFPQSRTVSTSVKDTVSFYTFCLALYVDELACQNTLSFRLSFPIFNYSPFSYKLETQFIYICTLRGHPYASIRIVFILIAFFSPELASKRNSICSSAQRPRERIKDYISFRPPKNTHRVSPLYYCIQLYYC